MGGLYTHMSRYVQLSAPEYQHHRKVDLRRPLGTTDFDGMDARDKTGSYNSYRHFRGTHSSRHDSCDAREAAWPVGPRVDSIVCPFVNVKRCSDLVGAIDGSRLR